MKYYLNLTLRYLKIKFFNIIFLFCFFVHFSLLQAHYSNNNYKMNKDLDYSYYHKTQVY